MSSIALCSYCILPICLVKMFSSKTCSVIEKIWLFINIFAYLYHHHLSNKLLRDPENRMFLAVVATACINESGNLCNELKDFPFSFPELNVVHFLSQTFHYFIFKHEAQRIDYKFLLARQDHLLWRNLKLYTN